jgi:hypothetical protein
MVWRPIGMQTTATQCRNPSCLFKGQYALSSRVCVVQRTPLWHVRGEVVHASNCRASGDEVSGSRAFDKEWNGTPVELMGLVQTKAVKLTATSILDSIATGSSQL